MQQARQRMQNMSPAAIFESVTATLTKKAEDRSAEECFFFAEWIMGLNIPIFENLHETTVKAPSESTARSVSMPLERTW